MKKTVKIGIFCFLLFVFYGMHIPAGECEANPQQRQEEIFKPAYEVEVIVTNIDVVVTDKKGNRVSGLKPENFEIYEDGYLQKLTNFYEIKEMKVFASVTDEEKEILTVPPEPVEVKPPRTKNKIIFYFDNWHLHPMNRNWSIKKLETFIRNNFSIENTDNQGMVVCLEQKLDVIQDFTSSVAQLIYAVNEVKKQTGRSNLRRREREDLRRELNTMVSEMGAFDSKWDVYDRARGYAKNFIDAEQNDVLYSLKSLSAFIDYLVGIEGKKMLIYISDGLPLNPGEEVFSFLDSVFPSGAYRTEAMLYDTTDAFKELTAKCNASEITLYPINAQGLESLILSADRGDGWIQTRGSGMMKSMSRTTNDALKLMAEDTGGVAVLNTNDIESGLEEVKGDLQFYYSLGYTSPHRDNEYHSIEIKLAGLREKYDVRVRKGYTRISQEDKIKEGVFSGLFLRRQYNPLNIMGQVMPVEKKSGSDKLNLTLKILIPIKSLTLYSQGKTYEGQIKVYITLMDEGGRISPCHELTEDIKIPAEDYEIAIKRSYPYFAEMYVNPGRYTVSVGVKDVPSGEVSYFQLQTAVEKE